MYKPHTPYNVPYQILIPSQVFDKGVRTKAYTEDSVVRFCSFRTFGGTENQVNGVFSLIDTATVETWYDPKLKADVRLRIYATDGSGTFEDYEVMGKPENIEMRNQYTVVKVRKVSGGA